MSSSPRSRMATKPHRSKGVPLCDMEIPADSKFYPGSVESADEIVAEKERKAPGS